MQNKGIIGAVCGDIIGSIYEFNSTKDPNFKLFTSQSTFTDDTVMTCAVAEAQISAEVTHNHPEGIIGAKAVAATIFLLRNGEWLEKGKKFLKEHCFYDLDEIEKNKVEIFRNYTFDVTCQGSVPEAIYCALPPGDYEDSIRIAISLGGDADTQAAIAGGIAASYSKVPDHILNECLDRLDPPLVDVIDKFNEFVK